jgi:oligosaccharide repeat unit polymerase
MTYLEYFASVGEAPGAYFLILIITVVCYLFILRKQLYSIFDPLFYATVFGAFATTCVVFLWWRDLIDTKYFIQFACTECAFFIGIMLFKPINFNNITIRAVDGGDQRRFLNALYMVSATTFIFTQAISYATLGVPFLLDSRLSYYAEGGGIGALGRIIGVSWSFSCYLLIYRLARNSGTGRRMHLPDIFVGIALLTSVVLSGSKSGLLQVIFLIFYSRFMLRRESSGAAADKFLRRLEKTIMIAAVFGAILIVSVKAGGGAMDGSIFVLLQRLAANGDVFFMAYPTHIIDTLSPRGGFLALFGSLLVMFRLVAPASLPEPLGFQIFRSVYGSVAFVGPNPRHNVFGVVYFGVLGAIIYSLMLGVMVGFVRNRIPKFIRRGSAIEPLYVFLAISCVAAPTDIEGLMMDIGSAILVAPFLYAAAAILSLAVPSSLLALRHLSLQSTAARDS